MPAQPSEAMQQILDAHAQLAPLPIETLSAAVARQMPLLDRAAVAAYGNHFLKKAMTALPLPVGAVEHRQLNEHVVVRIYTPKGTKPENGWPAILYFHGGGFVIAGLDTYDASCRALCDGAGAMVISLHYRQAPEHIFPAAVEDALLGYRYLLMNTAALEIDMTAIAIAGESAGGNLATVTCIAARTQGLPLPCHQLLVYPVTDMAMGFERASAREHAEAKPLNRAMLKWFYDQYAPESIDRRDPMISPVFARDEQLRGLPPTTIILAEIDPLCSDGEVYAETLRQAGVPVHFEIYKSVTHEFFGLAGLIPEATEAMATACKALKASFEHARESMKQSA